MDELRPIKSKYKKLEDNGGGLCPTENVMKLDNLKYGFNLNSHERSLNLLKLKVITQTFSIRKVKNLIIIKLNNLTRSHIYTYMQKHINAIFISTILGLK